MRKQRPWGFALRTRPFTSCSPCGQQSAASCRRGSRPRVCVVHRATTYYLADRRYDMLPSVLSADLCSLLGGVDRWVCSCFFFFFNLLSPALVLALLWYRVHSLLASFSASFEFALPPAPHPFSPCTLRASICRQLYSSGLPLVLSVCLALRLLLPLLWAFETQLESGYKCIDFVHIYFLVETVFHEDRELREFYCLFVVVNIISIFEYVNPYSPKCVGSKRYLVKGSPPIALPQLTNFLRIFLDRMHIHTKVTCGLSLIYKWWHYMYLCCSATYFLFLITMYLTDHSILITVAYLWKFGLFSVVCY